MRQRLAVGAVVAICGVPVPAAAGASHGPGDTGVIDVSSAFPNESFTEQPLSVSPTDPNRLATVANVFEPEFPGVTSPFIGGGGLQDSKVFTTADGGAHWLGQKLDQGGLGKLPNPLKPVIGGSPEFADALNIVNTDSDSAWDSHGNLYYESGDIHGLHHNGDEVETVWRSIDAGSTWGPNGGVTAVSASAEHNELDRPWLTIDNSGGPHDGRLYTTFETSPFVDDPPMVFVKHSDDHGLTWSPTVRVDDGTYETQFNPRNRPVVGAGGALYIVYDRAPISATTFTPQVGAIALTIARSSDGGQTFQRFVLDDNVHRVTDPNEAIPGYSEMIPAIAADSRRAGDVAVAWPEALGDASSRIMMRYSTDGGAHWSPRIEVSGIADSVPAQQDHVTLAYLPDGRLAVGWRDWSCCGGTYTDHYENIVRLAGLDRSGSATLGPTVQFTDGPQIASTAGRGTHGSGQPDEFDGLAATVLGVSMTWSQLQPTGFDELAYRRVPLAAFGSPPAPAGASPACVDRRGFAFHLHDLPGQRIVRATAYVNGRRVRGLRGHNLTRLALRRLPRATFIVRIVTVSSRGDEVISVRRYHGCAKTPPRTTVKRGGGARSP